jgi:hypothetical protein
MGPKNFFCSPRQKDHGPHFLHPGPCTKVSVSENPGPGYTPEFRIAILRIFRLVNNSFEKYVNLYSLTVVISISIP